MGAKLFQGEGRDEDQGHFTQLCECAYKNLGETLTHTPHDDRNNCICCIINPNQPGDVT